MEITLTEDSDHYAPGQVVTGVLRVGTDGSLRGADIKISLTGLEEVLWNLEHLIDGCDLCCLTPVNIHHKKNWFEFVYKVGAEQGKFKLNYIR